MISKRKVTAISDSLQQFRCFLLKVYTTRAAILRRWFFAPLILSQRRVDTKKLPGLGSFFSECGPLWLFNTCS